MFSIINTTYGTKVVFFLQLGHFYTANILLIYALCLSLAQLRCSEIVDYQVRCGKRACFIMLKL